MKQNVSLPNIPLKLILAMLFGLCLSACAPEPEVYNAELRHADIQTLFEC